ncbi:hypothetical protein CWR48_00205 [Oceanobacillus arenosus]|uniref:Uncharacterized protein n=2 Tax=Oceanobacillus arenosus TaxID=1229153 RepID=A0A3D8Q319_9BACI|nr:hypothetical protein CWR48_00205 [Oceanobacillus arenosus]
MASGMRLSSLMTAAASSLVAIQPDMENVMLWYAATSQSLTRFIGTYTRVFFAVPLKRIVYTIYLLGDVKSGPSENRKCVKFALVLISLCRNVLVFLYNIMYVSFYNEV